MMQWEVYVEGNSDRHFLASVVGQMKMVGFVWRVIEGGVSSLPAMQQQMLEGCDAGNRIAVIVDANTNVSSQRRDLHREIGRMELPIPVPSFLLPNDSEPGCLETLLEAMAEAPHGVVYNCLDQYGHCVRSHNSKYGLPDAKARIYAYCEALGIQTKPDERDYRNSDYWNMNAPAVDPLKQFLRSLQDI